MASTVTLEHAMQIAKENLLGIFGERDEAKRRTKMRDIYSEGIRFYEPDRVVTGHDNISRIVDDLLKANPAWEFKPAAKLWVNHDMVTLGWTFGPPGTDGIVEGNDLMMVNTDGKVDKMYTMIRGTSDIELK